MTHHVETYTPRKRTTEAEYREAIRIALERAIAEPLPERPKPGW